jgi:hypothetical protein
MGGLESPLPCIPYALFSPSFVPSPKKFSFVSRQTRRRQTPSLEDASQPKDRKSKIMKKTSPSDEKLAGARPKLEAATANH